MYYDIEASFFSSFLGCVIVRMRVGFLSRELAGWRMLQGGRC